MSAKKKEEEILRRHKDKKRCKLNLSETSAVANSDLDRLFKFSKHRVLRNRGSTLIDLTDHRTTLEMVNVSFALEIQKCFTWGWWC